MNEKGLIKPSDLLKIIIQNLFLNYHKIQHKHYILLTGKVLLNIIENYCTAEVLRFFLIDFPTVRLSTDTIHFGM